MTCKHPCILTPREIQAGVDRIAASIRHYNPEIIIGIMSGAAPLMVDLGRALASFHCYPQIKYCAMKRQVISEKVFVDDVYTPVTREDVCGKRVLIVDDVLDSGTTLHRLFQMMSNYEAKEFKAAVAVDKLLPGASIGAAWALLYGQRGWLIGYGMDDDDGRFRNLPGIHVKPGPESIQPAP